jgi:hypothetical protein
MLFFISLPFLSIFDGILLIFLINDAIQTPRRKSNRPLRLARLGSFRQISQTIKSLSRFCRSRQNGRDGFSSLDFEAQQKDTSVERRF